MAEAARACRHPRLHDVARATSLLGEVARAMQIATSISDFAWLLLISAMATHLLLSLPQKVARAMARYNLSEYIKAKRDGRQTHIELSDSTVLKVDPLELWSDEVLENITRDQVKAARALAGDEQYEKFKADGGTAALLLTIVQENQGVSAGEASPSPS